MADETQPAASRPTLAAHFDKPKKKKKFVGQSQSTTSVDQKRREVLRLLAPRALVRTARGKSRREQGMDVTAAPSVITDQAAAVAGATGETGFGLGGERQCRSLV